ncbi:MAG: hypothetical protein NC203_03960, partial [Firmicutes bacterium]|nr:hypothetical protein [Bacillota bacterium]
HLISSALSRAYILPVFTVQIYLVTMSQPAWRAANTLPIYADRIFMFSHPKIYLVTMSQFEKTSRLGVFFKPVAVFGFAKNENRAKLRSASILRL